jgi:hypothetical protein
MRGEKGKIKSNQATQFCRMVKRRVPEVVKETSGLLECPAELQRRPRKLGNGCRNEVKIGIGDAVLPCIVVWKPKPTHVHRCASHRP